eukprot:13222.XXX_545559_545762_1 [CDS] Oithona nana genome sequencing.
MKSSGKLQLRTFCPCTSQYIQKVSSSNVVRILLSSNHHDFGLFTCLDQTMTDQIFRQKRTRSHFSGK